MMFLLKIMIQQYHLIFLSMKDLTPEATSGQSNLT